MIHGAICSTHLLLPILTTGLLCIYYKVGNP